MKILYFLSVVIIFIYGFITSVARLFSPNGLSFEEIVSLSLTGISSLVAFIFFALLTKKNIFSNVAVFLPFIGLLTIGLQANGKIMLYLYPLIFIATAVLLGISIFKKNSNSS